MELPILMERRAAARTNSMLPRHPVLGPRDKRGRMDYHLPRRRHRRQHLWRHRLRGGRVLGLLAEARRHRHLHDHRAGPRPRRWT